MDIPKVSTESKKAHIMPELRNTSLIYIGKLCDEDCIETFSKEKVVITKEGETILSGERDHKNKLCNINMATGNQEVNLLRSGNNQTIQQRIMFLYEALFSPRISTLKKAIKEGHFHTWPLLITDNVTKYIPETIASLKGHMTHHPKNYRSTKSGNIFLSTTLITQTLDITEDNDCQKQYMYTTVENINFNDRTGRVYTDQTGRLPVRSRQGYSYIMIFYIPEINLILADPLSNRTNEELTKTFTKRLEYFKRKKINITEHWLDNEAVQGVINYDNNNDIQYQLTPPNVHREKYAERAIRIWKYHFINGLCTYPKEFPLFLWDRLIEQ